ncbi:MAG: hypothetical protein AAGF07_02845 [Patescibacteria group bacterium]
MSGKKLRLLGIVGVILIVVIAVAVVSGITTGDQDSDKVEANTTTENTQNRVEARENTTEISEAETEKENSNLRVDFNQERYNQRVQALNTRIRELKRFDEYAPSKEFCFAVDNVQGSAAFPVNALKLDINYNDKAPQFESIAEKTDTFSIACREHLEGSTGLLDEYKEMYREYIKDLEEIPLEE